MIYVSCRWWEIHQGPLMTGRFLSTSAHYLGSWLRNTPWYLGTSYINWNSPHSRRNVYINGLRSKDFVWCLTSTHLLTPYKLYYSTLRTLTSSVVSLTFVNGLHHRLTIRWCIPCSTSTHWFTWLDSYIGWSCEGDRRPWILFHPSGLWFQDYTEITMYNGHDHTDSHQVMDPPLVICGCIFWSLYKLC